MSTSGRISEAELAQAERQALKEIEVYMGEWSRTAGQVKAAFAEVRRLRALLERLAPVADGLVAPVPDVGPDRIMGPIVAELLAEARAIRDDAQAAHGTPTASGGVPWTPHSSGAPR